MRAIPETESAAEIFGQTLAVLLVLFQINQTEFEVKLCRKYSKVKNENENVISFK